MKINNIWKNAATWIAILLIAALSMLSLWLWIDNSYLKYKMSKNTDHLILQHLENLTGIGKLGSAHIHADFKIFVNGKEVNTYYKPENFEKNKYVHMHPGESEENVIHVHATGITLKHFFNTLNIILSRECISFKEEGKEFCTDNSKILKYYVNGKINADAPNYVIQDLDKILITYGDDSEVQIQKQLASIGNNACIQSKKC